MVLGTRSPASSNRLEVGHQVSSQRPRRLAENESLGVLFPAERGQGRCEEDRSRPQRLESRLVGQGSKRVFTGRMKPLVSGEQRRRSQLVAHDEQAVPDFVSNVPEVRMASAGDVGPRHGPVDDAVGEQESPILECLGGDDGVVAIPRFRLG